MSFSEAGRNLWRKVDGPILSGVLEDAKEPFKEGGFRGIGEHWLKALNARVEFFQVGAEDLEQSRKKLNEQAGLIIANHPGWVDVPAVLSAINRDDLLVMTNERLTEIFKSQLGDKYFVPATKNPSELRKQMDNVLAHIKSGGAFLFYPSGGPSDKFQGTLKHLLGRIEPQNMVYSFYTNPKDVNNIEKQQPERLLGLGSQVFLARAFNINKLKDPAVIHAQESYGSAAEWQALLGAGHSDEINRRLASHYLEKFKDNERG